MSPCIGDLLTSYMSKDFINVLYLHAKEGKNIKCTTYHSLLKILFEIYLLFCGLPTVFVV